MSGLTSLPKQGTRERRLTGTLPAPRRNYQGQPYWFLWDETPEEGGAFQVWATFCPECGRVFTITLPTLGIARKPNRRCDLDAKPMAPGRSWQSVRVRNVSLPVEDMEADEIIALAMNASRGTGAERRKSFEEEANNLLDLFFGGGE